MDVEAYNETILNTTCTYAEWTNFANSYCYTVLRLLLEFRWSFWLFWPTLIVFVGPFLLFSLLFGSSMFLTIYKYRYRLQKSYNFHFWKGARHTLAVFWEAHGKFWHGYELIGLDKLPVRGPALIIYYHGALPIDIYYFMAKCVLYRDIMLQLIVDRFMFMIPGLQILMEAMCCRPGTIQECVDLLNDKHMVVISPGGVREALFSDNHYEMIWGDRSGFAKIAIQAKIPIFPMFTQHCREAYRAVQTGRDLFRKFYEYTRLPLVPIYGGFPVKLRTYIGDPIPFDPKFSPEQLARKVESKLEELILAHQKIPGTILCALGDRLSCSIAGSV